MPRRQELVMILETFARMFARDLETVRRQLVAYPDPVLIWAPAAGVNNTGGTLGLHVAGNLRHFIGAQLGNSGFVRDREAEFTRQDVPLGEILDGLEAASREVTAALSELDSRRLDEEYPLLFGETRLTVGAVLIQLGIHLAYHLGQIDYHRRAVSPEPAAVPALSVKALTGPR